MLDATVAVLAESQPAPPWLHAPAFTPVGAWQATDVWDSERVLFVAANTIVGLFDSDAARPAQFVSRLISSGRASCTENPARLRVEVPLISATWLCFPSAPRLVGKVPGVGGVLFFSALQVFVDESSGFDVDDLRFTGRFESPRSDFRLHAASAHVARLSGSRAMRSRAHGALRALVVSGHLRTITRSRA